MSRNAHRNNDSRKCGGKTVVSGQSSVYVNGQLWSVLNDPDDHGHGNLINTTGDTVYIEGKPVIVHGPDKAFPDARSHPTGATDTGEGSPDVYAYASGNE